MLLPLVVTADEIFVGRKAARSLSTCAEGNRYLGTRQRLQKHRVGPLRPGALAHAAGGLDLTKVRCAAGQARHCDGRAGACDEDAAATGGVVEKRARTQCACGKGHADAATADCYGSANGWRGRQYRRRNGCHRVGPRRPWAHTDAAGSLDLAGVGFTVSQAGHCDGRAGACSDNATAVRGVVDERART